MSSEQPGNTPFSTTVPPTAMYATPPATLSKWPTVIGVIAVIFGVGGILGGLWGAVAPMFLGAMMKSMPAGGPNPMAGMDQMAGKMIVSGLLSAGVAVVLLLAGVGVLRRKQSGVQTAKIWAGLKMVWAVVAVVLGFIMQREQMVAMQSQMGMPSQMAEMMPVLQIVGLAFGLLWAWALPVFMLIWFSRAKIKAEVANWV